MVQYLNENKFIEQSIYQNITLAQIKKAYNKWYGTVQKRSTAPEDEVEPKGKQGRPRSVSRKGEQQKGPLATTPQRRASSRAPSKKKY